MTQKHSNRAAILVCAVVLAVAIVTASAPRGSSQEFSPFNPLFPFGTPSIQGSPMVGLAPGQTLRWNAVNIDPAKTCQLQLSILDSTGNAVVPPQIVTLPPGAASFLDFRHDPPSIKRMQVRTLAQELDGSDCAILLSVETFESTTLRTQTVLVADPTW